jgi:hypothetical protein
MFHQKFPTILGRLRLVKLIHILPFLPLCMREPFQFRNLHHLP